MYRALIISVLLYGGESQTTTATTTESFNSVQLFTCGMGTTGVVVILSDYSHNGQAHKRLLSIYWSNKFLHCLGFN